MSVVTISPSELGVQLVDAVEFLQVFVADGHGISEDSPLNSLGARRSGERSVVAPEVVQVESLDKVSKVHFSYVCLHEGGRSSPGSLDHDLIKRHLSEKGLSQLQGRFAGLPCFLSSDFGAVSLIEEDSKDTVGSLDFRVRVSSFEVSSIPLPH